MGYKRKSILWDYIERNDNFLNHKFQKYFPQLLVRTYSSMAGGTICLYCHRAGISFVSPPTTNFIHPQKIYFSWDWVRKSVGGYRVPVCHPRSGGRRCIRYSKYIIIDFMTTSDTLNISADYCEDFASWCVCVRKWRDRRRQKKYVLKTLHNNAVRFWS